MPNNIDRTTENTGLQIMSPMVAAPMPAVKLGGDFWTDAQSFGLALRMSNALAASTIIPKEYQGNPSNTLIALEMAARMNTSPMQVMQNLHIINGRPSWSSQYIIGVINSSRKYKHELKFALTGTGDDMECVAWTTGHSGERIDGPAISMKMAKEEGWVSRNGSKWKTMPEVMIRYRAAAFFGRLYCSDMIMGIYDRDEVIEMGDDYVYESAQAQAEAAIAKNANMQMIDAGEALPSDPPKWHDGVDSEGTDPSPPPAQGEEAQQAVDGYEPKF